MNADLSSGVSLGWYWNRLRCMSAGEIAYRVKQKLSAQAQQAGFSTARDVPKPDLRQPAHPFIAVDAIRSASSYVHAADKIVDGRLTVFDIEYRYTDVPDWNRDPKTGRTASLEFGKTLDYRDSALVGDIKYLWEPNRHLHLVTLAQAYRLTADARYLRAIERQLDSWFEQCRYLHGPNWASSLELGIRLINWSITWQLLGGLNSELFQGERGSAFRDRWLRVIYQHLHFIAGHYSRFSSANNHLIGEAAGVYIGAVTWPFWPQARRWRTQARRELTREALLQNARDGVNREQAIAYQQFVADFLLFAALAGRHNGDEFPREYWERLQAMIGFVASVIDVGGHVPMIGDADDGYVVTLSPAAGFCPYRSLLATGAALFGRGDYKAKAGDFDDKSRWLLGRAGVEAFERVSSAPPVDAVGRAFPEGGYYILGCDFDTPDEVRIVADAGALGYQRIAAHGHADALSFTLSFAGREFLIDPGTYAYHTEREWRNYFRGTAAHNTVRVDGEDQSVNGGNFLWLHHAQARCVLWRQAPDQDRFVGVHDGYRRLADPVTHERELIFDKTRKRLQVIDSLRCQSRHQVELCWHFAEDVTVRVSTDGPVIAAKDGYAIRLHPPRPDMSAKLYRGASDPPWGWVSRRFGVKQAASTVVWTGTIDASTQFSSVVECVYPEARNATELERVAKGATDTTLI